jgi:hypothetical protein
VVESGDEGVMTDSGDEGSTRRAFYGGITFRSDE